MGTGRGMPVGTSNGLAGLLAASTNASASVESSLMGKCALSVTASYKANAPTMCAAPARLAFVRVERGSRQHQIEYNT